MFDSLFRLWRSASIEGRLTRTSRVLPKTCVREANGATLVRDSIRRHGEKCLLFGQIMVQTNSELCCGCGPRFRDPWWRCFRIHQAQNSNFSSSSQGPCWQSSGHCFRWVGRPSLAATPRRGVLVTQRRSHAFLQLFGSHGAHVIGDMPLWATCGRRSTERAGQTARTYSALWLCARLRTT